MVVNTFRKKTTFSGKVSTIPGNCQLVQKNDCQPHQEKEQKLSTKIRKRHVHLSGYMVTPVTVTVFRTKLRRGEYEG